jgi:hypothetical protein
LQTRLSCNYSLKWLVLNAFFLFFDFRSFLSTNQNTALEPCTTFPETQKVLSCCIIHFAPAHHSDQSNQVYDKIGTRLPKNWSSINEFVLKVILSLPELFFFITSSHYCIQLQIGQMQIIRRLIAHELSTTCEYDSKLLFGYLNRNKVALTAFIRHFPSFSDTLDVYSQF